MSRILIPVTNSSSIQGYAINRKRHLLAIQFAGRPDIYIYENVALLDMLDFERAESKGSFINQRIVPKYQRFDRLAEEEFAQRYGTAFLTLRSVTQEPSD